MKTYSPKPEHIERSWYVVDASGQVLGRLASEVATLLRGKHKPIFAPHMDTGDHVVVINADKVELSGNKAQNKFAYRHSGYPGGITGVRYADLLATRPVAAVEKAIRGMLPKNRLGRQQIKKLHVVAGAEHPHSAQKPVQLAVGAERIDGRRGRPFDGGPEALPQRLVEPLVDARRPCLEVASEPIGDLVRAAHRGAGHPAGRPDRSCVAAAPEARGSGAGRGGGAHDQGTYPEIRRPEVACQEARGGEAGSQEGAGGLGSEEICRIDNVGEETDRQEARGDHVRCQEADREEVDREEVRGEATREDGGVICRWP